MQFAAITLVNLSNYSEELSYKIFANDMQPVLKRPQILLGK